MNNTFDFQTELNQKFPNKTILTQVKCLKFLTTEEHRQPKGFVLDYNGNFSIPRELEEACRREGEKTF